MLIRVALFGVLLLAAPAVLASYILAPYISYPTGSWADAAAIGDVNGDGRNDVILATNYASGAYAANAYKVLIYIQNPDGSLAQPHKESYGATAYRNGLVLADLDHDKRMEIVVGHGGGITILKWGPFRDRTVASRPYSAVDNQAADDVAVADVNRDGHLDVVSQSWADGATIYFGDGKGLISRTIKLQTPAQGYNDLESGDFNGDGHEDIVVLSGQGYTYAYVYYNDGTDDFSAPLVINPNPDTYATVGAVGGGDFNGDGRDDLAVTRSRTELSLFNQNAAGGFQALAILSSASDSNAMVGHDLNTDGREDLIVLHGGGALGFYLQGDSGIAQEAMVPGVYGTWFNTQGLAAGDINGDKCPDVVAANYYGLVVYRGDGCNAAADLSTNLGLTTTRIAVRLDNFGTGAALEPEVAIVLSVANGNLALGGLPAGCSVASQTPLRAEVLCAEATLTAGTSRTLMLPISISGGELRNLLTVTANAQTTTAELRVDNNLVTATLRGSLAPPTALYKKILSPVAPKTSLQRLGGKNLTR